MIVLFQKGWGGWKLLFNPFSLGFLKYQVESGNICQRQEDCPKPSKCLVFRSKDDRIKQKESETADSLLRPIPCSKSCVQGGGGGGYVLLNSFLFWAQVLSVFSQQCRTYSLGKHIDLCSTAARWFCSSHYGCSSVMKSSMPWFQKGQQFTAPEGTQGGALSSLRSWCVTAYWGYCSFSAPSGHSHIFTTLMSQFSLGIMRVLRWSLVLHPSTQPGAQLRMDPQKMRCLSLGFICMCLICSGCHNKTPQTGALTTEFS